MILRLPCAVANPTSIASTTNATPPTVLFAPHHCRKTAALKANKIRNLFYFTEFLFLSPPIATQYGVGYAYCPMGNTATQLAPIALQYGARATPIARWAIRLRNWRLLLRNTALGLRLLPDGQYGYAIGAYCCAIRRSDRDCNV